MAAPYSGFPAVLVQKSSLMKKPVINKIIMFKQGPKDANEKPSELQIRSSIRKKVFEDQSSGIVCYRNDCGEVICEGFDEGPRYHHRLQKSAAYNTSSSRDAEIISLLQPCWIQLVYGSEDNYVDILPEDFKWNGFNKFF